MVQALKLVLEEGRSPQNLRTDKGVEFKNKEVKKLMEQSGIYHFFTQNESKVNYAERAIKNIKSRLSRYRSRNQSNRRKKFNSWVPNHELHQYGLNA